MLTNKDNYMLADDAVQQLRGHIERWLAEPGHNMTALSEQAGMNITVVRDFLEADHPYPTVRFLLGIGHVLGYTVNELLGQPASRLSPTDETLLQAFREMTPENRERLLDVAVTWTASREPDEEPNGEPSDTEPSQRQQAN